MVCILVHNKLLAEPVYLPWKFICYTTPVFFSSLVSPHTYFLYFSICNISQLTCVKEAESKSLVYLKAYTSFRHFMIVPSDTLSMLGDPHSMTQTYLS